jgi:type I restriction enzyme R subunit
LRYQVRPLILGRKHVLRPGREPKPKPSADASDLGMVMVRKPVQAALKHSKALISAFVTEGVAPESQTNLT